MSRAAVGGAVLLLAGLAALYLALARPESAQATHLCGNTGSVFGPFPLLAYEAADWKETYAATLEVAAFNQLFPEIPEFALPPLKTGPRNADTQRDPYIPPTILKSIAWLESSWAQAAYSVPYGQVGPVLASHDCGYGIMQVTTGMQNISGVPSLEQAMIGGHFAFNIARGARILADKWNMAPEKRPLVGTRDPALLEDWYYAVWGYNGFAFKNHPLNPDYATSRVPYSCGDPKDGLGHDRSKYPYQELILGCVANPPLVKGVPLWAKRQVHLPDLADPQFNKPLQLENWNPCVFELKCAAMDMPRPNPAHPDPRQGTATRADVIGSPVLSISAASLSLKVTAGAVSAAKPLTVSNVGTKILAWRAVSSQPWIRLSAGQGVALGTDLGSLPSNLNVSIDASTLRGGTYTGKITFESLAVGNSPLEVHISVQVDESCQPFADMVVFDWACTYVQALHTAKVTSGCSASPMLYCPNGRTTRAEMAAFILRAMGHGDHLAEYRGYFVDVPAGQWFTGYVEHLFEHNITTGCAADLPRFCPNGKTTRAEMAVFIVRALGETPLETPSGTVFSDVSTVHWAARYIEKLAQLGFATGYPDGTFRPQETVTRAEVAAFISRAWNLPAGALQTPTPTPSPSPPPLPTTTNTPSP